MDYNFSKDVKAIRAILELSQSELADKLGVQQITISRNENEKTSPSEKLLELVYSFAYSNNIQLNLLKEMFWKEEIEPNHKLLFHGAKSEMVGNINPEYGRKNNDFGQGFYAGESYKQAVTYVSGYSNSSVYLIDFDDTNLKCRKYTVDQDWMMTIAYYRGGLEKYKNHKRIKKLVSQSRDADYIIAPIADNRMYQIINSFVYGDLTDEQCKHALSATNLGMQYIFLSDQAAKRTKLIERCYLCENEKDYYKNLRSNEAKLGEDKVRLAKVDYRGKGKYIDEILG